MQVGDEVTGRVLEPIVELQGRLLIRSPRAFTWVLDRQGGGDDQDLLETAVAIGLEDHSGKTWVERNPCQLSARRGQPLTGAFLARVDGVEFLEKRDAISDRTAVGRVDEGEALDVAEPDRRHLQDDRCQAGPLDLGLGEGVASVEVGLGIEANADAGTESPTSTGPLVRRRLRHFLDGKPLHLGAAVEPRDPGETGVDHVANARNGERGLGDVGGQHDPASRVRLEDPLLLGRGQPRIQRDDFGVAKLGVGQRFGCVSDLTLARTEDEHVAFALALEFSHGIDDRLGLVANLGVFVTV